MEAAHHRRDDGPRRICDVCDAYSSAERGSLCTTCSVGTMRYLSELQVVRQQRRQDRRAALRSEPKRP